MADEKRRDSSEDEKSKDVLSIVSKQKRNEEIKNERSEDETKVVSIAENPRARQEMGTWRVSQCYEKRSVG